MEGEGEAFYADGRFAGGLVPPAPLLREESAESGKRLRPADAVVDTSSGSDTDTDESGTESDKERRRRRRRRRRQSAAPSSKRLPRHGEGVARCVDPGCGVCG
jgi:hypothetical protein